MKKEELEKLCEGIIPPIKEVGNYIRRECGRIHAEDVETKSLNSLVSYVDQEAELRLVKIMSAALPDAGFLTEEETIVAGSNSLRWVIDPLDGTTNFLHQLPFYSISIALEIKGEIALGIILECNSMDCYYSWKAGGAFLNGKTISVSRNKLLEDCLLATGFPYFNFDQLDAYFEALRFFMKGCRGIRRFGSAALDLAFVASGKFDGFFETNLNPWDVSAGVLLVKEAGGVVTDFNLKDNAQSGVQILATNGLIHDQMIEPLKKLA